MEGKDFNRSKSRNSQMKKQQYHKNHSHDKAAGAAHHLNASKNKAGLVDVRTTDSSDDARMRKWASSKVSPQPNRHLDMPPSDDYDEYYDENSMEYIQNAQMKAGDFSLMSQLPTSIGGHFQFSSEKQWYDEEGDANELSAQLKEASEYFTLNLKLIGKGLQTIPFHKRMEYPSSYFSKDQLATMESDAEKAEADYQKLLKDHLESPRININSASSRKSASAKSQTNKSSTAPNPIVVDDLDELLNMTASVSVANEGTVAVEEAAPPTEVVTANAASEAATSQANKDDIQQWLDNVLEE